MPVSSGRRGVPGRPTARGSGKRFEAGGSSPVFCPAIGRKYDCRPRNSLFEVRPVLIVRAIGPILFGVATRYRVGRLSGGVAQSVEQRPFKPWVLGSSPSTLSRFPILAKGVIFTGDALWRFGCSTCQGGTGDRGYRPAPTAGVRTGIRPVPRPGNVPRRSRVVPRSPGGPPSPPGGS